MALGWTKHGLSCLIDWEDFWARVSAEIDAELQCGPEWEARQPVLRDIAGLIVARFRNLPEETLAEFVCWELPALPFTEPMTPVYPLLDYREAPIQSIFERYAIPAYILGEISPCTGTYHHLRHVAAMEDDPCHYYDDSK